MQAYIDASQIEAEFKAFRKFTLAEQQKTVLTSMRKGARYIINQTKKTFKTKLPRATHKGKWKDTLVDAVLRSKTDFERDTTKMFVHVMGRRTMGKDKPQSSKSGTFRARFFEQGTQDRYVKTYRGKKLAKPRFVGRIKPLWYLRESVNHSQSEYANIVSKEFNAMVNKINQTY